ncbi:D-Ala-D-Ala carboxypeptidase family metallohydrolase [Streptomyces sp. NPDC004284]|uniref:D-Ala-D-Ala carboxypeptidase family metallohydrolase n=1 Tax=Streptomyces sp. NPDC004284 TaxID=3364695 RepID=UPI0036A0FB80
MSAMTVKESVRRNMYELEALRKKSGALAVTANSGFRVISHNASVGGDSNSMHRYGIAADVALSGCPRRPSTRRPRPAAMRAWKPTRSRGSTSAPGSSTPTDRGPGGGRTAWPAPPAPYLPSAQHRGTRPEPTRGRPGRPTAIGHARSRRGLSTDRRAASGGRGDPVVPGTPR